MAGTNWSDFTPVDAPKAGPVDWSQFSPAKQGAVSYLASQAKAGLTADLPTIAGKALQYAGATDLGGKMRAYGEANAAQAQPDESQGAITKLAAGAIRGAAPVVPLAVGGLAANVLAPQIAVPLELAGAAGLAGGFGGAQAQDTLEKAKASGLSDEAATSAARKTGMITGVGMGAVGALTGGVAAPAIRALAGTGAKTAAEALAESAAPSVARPFVADTAGHLAGNVASMAASNAGVAKVEQDAGLPGPTPGQAALEGVESGAGLTAALLPFGLARTALAHKANTAAIARLTSPDTDPAQRAQVADQIHANLNAIDPEAAGHFADNVTTAINGKQPLELGPHLLGPPEAAPEPAAPLALPAPVVRVDEHGNARMDGVQPPVQDEPAAKVIGQDITDVEPKPSRSEAMGLDPNAGPISRAAVLAVDSGAHDHVVAQAAQVAVEEAASKGKPNESAQAAQEQARVSVQAAAPERDQASIGAPAILGADRGAGGDVSSVPGVGDRRPVTGAAEPAASAAPALTPRTGEGSQSAMEAMQRQQQGKPSVQPTDILNDQGAPFRNRMAAGVALKKAGAGHEVAPLAEGGFVVRPLPKSEAPAPAEPKALHVGITPGNAEPVTIKDGIVHIGKEPALDFNSGDPVKVKAGASDADLKQALKDAGALSRRQKFFGGEAEAPDNKLRIVNPKGPAGGRNARSAAYEANPLKAFIAEHGLAPELAQEFAPGIRERRAAMVPGYGPIFRKGGLKMDALAERAEQDGFIPKGDHDANRLYDLVARAMRGERVIPQYAEGAVEKEAQKHIDAHRELADLMPHDLDAEGYERVDPELQAEVRSLIDKAERSGIDYEAILDDVVKKSKNGTQDEYHAAASKALREALDAHASEASARAQDRGGPAGAQGDEPAQRGKTEGLSNDRAGNRASATDAAAVPSEAGGVSRAAGADHGNAAGQTRAVRRSGEGVRQPDSAASTESAPADVRGLTPAADNTAQNLSDFFGRVLKRHVMEARGQDILDGMEERGESPGDVADKFWTDTYFKLPANVQERFKRMAANHGGDNILTEKDKPREVLDMPSKVEMLEGTERGFVALMKEANDRFAEPEKPALTAPTKADIAAAEARKESAPALAAKAQIDREAKDQTLTQPVAPEQRKDTSGDMFAREKAQAEVDKKNEGKPKDDGGTVPMFSQEPGAADDGIAVKPGKGLITGKFLSSVDGNGTPGGPWNTEGEARAAAEAWRTRLEQVAAEKAVDRARKDAFAQKLRDGHQPTPAEVEGLGLRARGSDLTYFIPHAAELFGISSRAVRPLIADIIRVGHTDMGAKRESVNPMKALAQMGAALKGETPSLRQDTTEGVPLRVSEIRKAIAPALNSLKVPYELHSSIGEARDASGLKDIPGGVKGMYYSGKLHLVAEGIKSALEAEETLWHEVNHAGIDRTYGSSKNTEGYYNAMRGLAMQNANIREAAKEWLKEFGADDTRARIAAGMTRDAAELRTKLQAVEEALSNLAGKNAKINGAVRFIAKVQEFMRAVGLNRLADALEGKTDAQALAMIFKAREAVTKEPRTERAPQLAPSFSEDHASFSRTLDKISDRIDSLKAGVGASKGGALHSAVDGLMLATMPDKRSTEAGNVGQQLRWAQGLANSRKMVDRAALNKAVAETTKAVTLAEKLRDAVTMGLTKADKLFVGKKDIGWAFMQAKDSADKTLFAERSDLKAVADAMTTLEKSRVKIIQDLDTGALQNLRENWFRHMWKQEPDADTQREIFSTLSKRPFGQAPGSFKARVYDDFMAGVKAGLKPVSDNPMDIWSLAMHELDKYIIAHGVLRATEGSNGVHLIAAGEMTPKGYTDINGRFGNIERNGEKLRYVARDDVAQVVNNYVSQSLYHNKYVGTAFSKYMGAANTLNQFQLGVFSAFHAGFTSMEAVISHGALGVKAASEGDWKGAAKYMATAPAAWINNPRMGDKILAEWLNRGSHPEVAHIIAALEMAGARFEMDNRFRTDYTKNMMQAWGEGKKFKAGINSIGALTEQSARPILEWLVPRQKAGVFGEMWNRWIEKNPNATHEEMLTSAQQIWNRVDSRLGQVVYDRLFVHNVAKNFAQMLIRAPGWTGGTILEVGGGLMDLSKWATQLPLSVAKGEKPAGMSDRAAYTASMLLVTAVANATMTALFTGESPQDWRDLVAFRTGNIDENGRPERFMLPTYMKDVYAYAKAPGTTLLNKSHPLLSLIGDIGKNRDFYGTEIRSEDANILTQLVQTAGFAAKAFVPFWVKGVQKEQQREGSALATAAPLVGVMPAPSDLNKTAAEKLMTQYGADRMPQGSRTQEETDKADLRREMYVALRKGEQDKAKEIFDQGREKGLFGPRDYLKVIRQAKSDPLTRNFGHLTYEQAQRVMKVATDEEKQELAPAFMKKRIAFQRQHQTAAE